MSKENRKGFALITVLCFISILFLLGVAMTGYAGSDLHFANMQKNSIQALYLALSGIEYASAECGSWNFSGSAPIVKTEKVPDAGEFTVSAKAFKINNVIQSIDVTSVGQAGKNKRTVYAELSPGGSIQKIYPQR
ncbi:MAG: hypothetical protein ABIH00_02715 [Armatimonadota bacterium]